MGRRVRKVGVGGVESGCGVEGVKGRKSWDRGVGSEEVEVGGLELEGLGVGSEEFGSRGLDLGGLGSGVLGLVKLGSGRLKSGGRRRRGWGS